MRVGQAGAQSFLLEIISRLEPKVSNKNATNILFDIKGGVFRRLVAWKRLSRVFSQ